MENLTRAEQSDRHLLARIAAQDREALRQLHGRYYRSVASFLASITKRPDLVDEMVNDTFMLVWKTARSSDGQARISTWILGIAYRRGLGSEGNETRAQTEIEVRQDPATSSECTAQVEMIDCGNALPSLPIEQRAVLQLCYRFGLSCEEIGMLMGFPVNTVKTKMLYARRMLRIGLCRSDRSMPSPKLR